MHSAISYITYTAEELSKASEIPTKKLRGVLSSLVKKDVFMKMFLMIQDGLQKKLCLELVDIFGQKLL